MDWTIALGCLGKFTLTILAIFGVLCIIAIRYSWRLKKSTKAKIESQPKLKEGRVVLREVVEGIHGMSDSYIAEIRDLGIGDTRLHVYDVNGHLIMETRSCECYKLGLMLGIFGNLDEAKVVWDEYYEKIKRSLDEKDSDET